MLGIAADLSHPAFHVRIEPLGVGEIGPGGEHDLGRLGRKLAAGVGGTGLDDDGPALHGAGDIERAAHREVFPLVVQHMQLVRVEIDAAVDVAHEGIVGKAVPKARHHVVEFACAGVAFAVVHVLLQPEVQRRIGIGGGDDVPARAPAADVVEGGEPAGDVVGLVERGGAGSHQPYVLGDSGQGRQQRERLERCHRMAALQGLERHVEHRQMIGHEEGVEPPALQRLCETLQMREIEVGIRRRLPDSARRPYGC